MAARQGGKDIHPLQHPAQQGHIAIKLAGRLADHRIELGGAA